MEIDNWFHNKCYYIVASVSCTISPFGPFPQGQCHRRINQPGTCWVFLFFFFFSLNEVLQCDVMMAWQSGKSDSNQMLSQTLFLGLNVHTVISKSLNVAKEFPLRFPYRWSDHHHLSLNFPQYLNSLRILLHGQMATMTTCKVILEMFWVIDEWRNPHGLSHEAPACGCFHYCTSDVVLPEISHFWHFCLQLLWPLPWLCCYRTERNIIVLQGT